MDDAKLVRQALAGSSKAYGELIDRWGARVVALCHGCVGPGAEWPAGEALLRGFEELPSLPDPQRFGPWLAGVASSACRDWLRGRPERPEVPPGSPLAEVEALPTDCRLPLLLHLYQPGSYAELGHLLDLSPVAVGQRLVKARMLLTTEHPPADGDECDRYRGLLAARLDGEIQPRESELLDLHLAECHPCRSLAREWLARDRELRACFAPLREGAAHLVVRVKGQLRERGVRKPSVLVVDDESYILPTLRALLSGEFEVLTASSANEAVAILSQRGVDVVLSDQRMPGTSGVQLLEWVRQNSPQAVRLLMTGYSELEDAVDAINRGHVYYYLLKPWRTDELLQILRNAAEKVDLERKRERYLEELRQLNQELERRVAERTRELEEANLLLRQRTGELERLALTDPLTGLFNRRAIDELVRFELKRHARYPSPLALGFVDVDHFKAINTQYLLTGGDEVLKGLARVLTGSLREVDSVGRVGGEEFLVVARETGLEGAHTLAERIRRTVEESPIDYNNVKIPVTVSVGFAVAEAGVPVEHARLVELAASALADAKRNGRNRCEIRVVEGDGA